jgi:hypothetical protein
MSTPGTNRNKLTLLALKAGAWQEFGSLPGVQGVGLGDRRLRVYVRNADAGRQIPQTYHDVPVDIIVVGEVMAA